MGGALRAVPVPPHRFDEDFLPVFADQKTNWQTGKWTRRISVHMAIPPIGFKVYYYYYSVLEASPESSTVFNAPQT